MKPHIDETKFGSITIPGENYAHDVMIRLNGRVEKRKKKLSMGLFGTSHIVSLPEAADVYEDQVKWIIIGSGQSGTVRLSAEVEAFLQGKGCSVRLLPTAEAVRCWNETKEAAIGLLHGTC